ncbi:MAG: 50S ribosomal protein L24 [Buchnera aphidicola (Pentalonia nigronervosa)]|jgi:large subunit ribosomal protein L24|uniref:Large ribosomal subunit protein uL24 n=1 Tax=Buchnera aphidicola (Pentalonia nigronervosa) TaxID=1309793 RepID=A0A7H1AYY3_9GAMM|nr:MAG: 50S ribosomal protein L24 [Buchnera aphidicola (Pentalonia nigronervosa)]
MASKLRYNDNIIILTGKNKGKTGSIKSFLSFDKVIINHVNLVKKHQKPIPSQNKSGSIIEKEAPIHVSNIAIFNSETKKSDRVGFRYEKGKKVRFFKSNGKLI